MPQTITGPYTHKNLSVFPIHEAGGLESDFYVTLEEALDQQKVHVEETGDVRELLIENLFVDKDVFIQAGYIVRDGRQVRLFTMKTEQTVLFETQDREMKSPWIHRNYIVLTGPPTE